MKIKAKNKKMKLIILLAFVITVAICSARSPGKILISTGSHEQEILLSSFDNNFFCLTDHAEGHDKDDHAGHGGGNAVAHDDKAHDHGDHHDQAGHDKAGHEHAGHDHGHDHKDGKHDHSGHDHHGDSHHAGKQDHAAHDHHGAHDSHGHGDSASHDHSHDHHGPDDDHTGTHN